MSPHVLVAYSIPDLWPQEALLRSNAWLLVWFADLHLRETSDGRPWIAGAIAGGSMASCRLGASRLAAFAPHAGTAGGICCTRLWSDRRRAAVTWTGRILPSDYGNTLRRQLQNSPIAMPPLRRRMASGAIEPQTALPFSDHVTPRSEGNSPSQRGWPRRARYLGSTT
jgi:hypothetical protein